eukprot:1154311-Amorphochlora_amoeboformis.AAC.1
MPEFMSALPKSNIRVGLRHEIQVLVDKGYRRKFRTKIGKGKVKMSSIPRRRCNRRQVAI